MLLELNILNFALIDSLKIEFNKGLNILTGETGAGKSIIIDALGLVLGQRASRDSIRQGQDRMIVEAFFSVSKKNKKNIVELFTANGIDMEEDGSIIMSREVLSTGKNTCRVNGRMVTVSTMKQLSELLIDIHGQHEHQSLLHWETHMGLLDSYGGLDLETLLNTTRNHYQEYKFYKQSLKELMRDEMEIEREKDLIKFQLEEINQGKLENTQEEEELENRRKILNHSEILFENSQQAYELLYGANEEQTSIYDQLSKTLYSLEQMSSIDGTMKTIEAQVSDAILLIEDAGFVLRDYNERVEFSPIELDQIEKRLYDLNDLKRKYGENIEEIITYKESLQKKLLKIENKNIEVEQLQLEIKKYWELYMQSANQLSKARADSAKKLEKNIIQELQDLGMKKIQFKVDIQSSEEHASKYGKDRVEFLISTNPGQDLRPLAKIASGGEIARIMLALKSILADADNIDSLIFDEIDTGISGRTAQVVAEKMEVISRSYQTICITHLPQIASMADSHYLIDKEIKNKQTFTTVKPLQDKGKTEELARMLGGAILTELTISHAKEMIEMAQEIKEQSFK